MQLAANIAARVCSELNGDQTVVMFDPASLPKSPGVTDVRSEQHGLLRRRTEPFLTNDKYQQIMKKADPGWKEETAFNFFAGSDVSGFGTKLPLAI